MIRRFSAGLIAAAAFAFIAPLAATAKGYQPSMVDSTAIEGQFLIAGAGNKEACERKGKRWKPRSSRMNISSRSLRVEYCNGDGSADVDMCSCQQ